MSEMTRLEIEKALAYRAQAIELLTAEVKQLEEENDRLRAEMERMQGNG